MKTYGTSSTEHDKQLVTKALEDIFTKIPEPYGNTNAKLSNIRVQFNDHVDSATGCVRTVHASATLKLNISSYVDTNTLNQI